MTNNSQQVSLNEEQKAALFGGRLRSARESMGFDMKDVATQLRLNQNVIQMLEQGQYADIHTTFIRGYIRNYARFLQIPEQETQDILQSIKYKSTPPTQTTTQTERGFINQLCSTRDEFSTGDNRFMQFFTYIVVFTLIGLVGSWWYSHSSVNSVHDVLAAATQQIAPLNTAPPELTPVAANVNAPVIPVITSPATDNQIPAATSNPASVQPVATTASATPIVIKSSAPDSETLSMAKNDNIKNNIDNTETNDSD